MRCLIVDDDEMSRTSLKMLCDKIEGLEVVGQCANGLEAIKVLKSTEADLMFLDIRMPDLSGMELVRSVEDLPQIIFTTAHAEYAVEAFEYQVTDFLVKPIELPRLIKAVQSARERMVTVADNMSELFVKVDGRYVRLNLSEVLYIESLGDYVTFRTKDKSYIVLSTLKNIDDKIKNDHFLKVHRSYIVNLSKIVDIEETNMVVHDKVIPISRSNRATLMSRIKTI